MPEIRSSGHDKDENDGDKKTGIKRVRRRRRRGCIWLLLNRAFHAGIRTEDMITDLFLQ